MLPIGAHRAGSKRSIRTAMADFRSTALWPGDRYEVAVSAAGFAKSQAVVQRGEAGKVHDLATIALVRTNVTVGGIVVDSAGKPVTGVTVFNQGDAPRTLSATTRRRWPLSAHRPLRWPVLPVRASPAIASP